MAQERCRGCRHFFAPAKAHEGVCRAHPPTRTSRGTLWPEVQGGDYCGEWVTFRDEVKPAVPVATTIIMQPITVDGECNVEQVQRMLDENNEKLFKALNEQ